MDSNETSFEWFLITKIYPDEGNKISLTFGSFFKFTNCFENSLTLKNFQISLTFHGKPYTDIYLLKLKPGALWKTYSITVHSE